jgi:hypothetical protein
MENQRNIRAIERNLAELQWAILHRNTLEGIAAVKSAHHLFLHSVYNALFNDYIAHCIKVFEESGEAASFWYIHRINQKHVDGFAKTHGIDLSTLKTVSQKLKHIRNKTHFHIDSKGVLDPTAIWGQAALKGSELASAVDEAWQILTHLQNLLGLPEVRLPEYTVDDAKSAALRVEGRVGYPLREKELGLERKVGSDPHN